MPSIPHKRRTYLVDRSFQLKYTALLSVAGAAVCLVFGGLMYFTHAEAVRALPLRPGAEVSLRHVDLTLLLLTLLMSLMMGAALALFGVLVTHRVAGPVHVLQRDVNALAEGRFPRYRPLRQGDELRGVFARFHAAVDGLRAREEAEVAALDQALGALVSSATTAGAEEAITALRALAERKRTATSAAEPVAPARDAA